MGERRVLVVDDDPVIVKLLEVNLRLDGFVVDSAARGDEALDAASRNPPDLILLDVVLPGLGGYELVRLMRQDPSLKDIPVILLSARPADDPENGSYALGIVDRLQKPFDPVALLEVVHRHLPEGNAEP
jgi:DNA-binding response OmpR family regulator